MSLSINYQGTEAVLEDDGTWQSANRELALYLNSLFSPELYPASPAAGAHPRAAQARAASRALGASVAWPSPVTDEDDGLVY